MIPCLNFRACRMVLDANLIKDKVLKRYSLLNTENYRYFLLARNIVYIDQIRRSASLLHRTGTFCNMT